MATAAQGARGFDFARSYVRWHFPIACSLLLLLSLVAFSDNLVTNVSQPSNSDPKFIVHGLFLLAWMILLLIQSCLPRMGKLSLHRRLGNWGFAIAAGVVLSTLYVFVVLWPGWSALAVEARANRLLLPLYTAYMIAGYRTRHRPELHKRFVYAGTLFLLSPVLSRTYDPLIAPLLPPMQPGEDDAFFFSYLVAIWASFYFGLMLYDWCKSRKLHVISWSSFAATCAVYALVSLA